jgi:hypothetical protein
MAAGRSESVNTHAVSDWLIDEDYPGDRELAVLFRHWIARASEPLTEAGVAALVLSAAQSQRLGEAIEAVWRDPPRRS